MNRKIVFIILLVSFAFSAESALAAENLVINPTFEATGANGDPEGWLRGGYGQNTRGYGVFSCKYYTEEDLLNNDSNSPNFVFRPDCPPHAKFRLSTSISNYIDGDSKWYFKDVAIGSNKNFTLSYQYQAYNSRSRVIARYAFPGGTFQYQFLSEMPPLITLGMGYVSWVKAEREFTAPQGATSLTIFFAVGADGVCSTICNTTDRGGALSITNIVLAHKETAPAPVSNLIYNPSLEIDAGNNNPQSWFRGGWGTNARVFTYPIFGVGNASAFFFDKKAAKVEITSYTSGDAKWYFKEVPVTGGKTYTFSDVYRSTVPQNATLLTVFHSIYKVGSLEIDSYSLTLAN